MTGLSVLLKDLAQRSVSLWVEDGALKFKSPKGALDDSLKESLREYRDEIIAYLTMAPGSDPAGSFPLTDVQQAYWIGRSDAYALGNVGCHIYMELENKDLDVQKLTASWNQLIQRHEMMRAVILPDGNQVILDDVPDYEIKSYDLTACPPQQREETLESIRNEMSHQVFKAEEWPSFDIRISSLQHTKRLHVSMDYLFMDASSHLIIFHEWFALYENQHSALPELPISFRDHVLYRERLKLSPKYAQDVKYWHDRITEFPPPPPLPVQQQAVTKHRPTFIRKAATLDKELWQAVKDYGKKHQLTPSVILLAAFSDILSAWSAAQRFALNLTLFNREQWHPAINNLVGEFTQLSLLEVDYSHEEPFWKRASRIQNQMMDDLDHNTLSAVQFLRDLARKNEKFNQVLMPVVFTSTVGYGASDTVDDSEVFKFGEVVYSITQSPQVWLDYQVMEYEGALVYNWDSVEGIFPGSMLEDMFQAHHRLLQELAQAETQWAAPQRPMLSSDQLEQLRKYNDTDLHLPQETMVSLFLQQAKRAPDKVCVVDAQRQLSYREVENISAAVASKLVSSGAKRGDVFGVYFKKGWRQLIATLAVMRANCAYLPIDTSVPYERLKTIAENANLKGLLVEEATSTELSIPQLMIDDIGNIEQSSRAAGIDQANPDDLAYVIYTSGSTGSPKGVMIDHQGATNTILDINQRFNVDEKDCAIAISALGFDLSVYDFFGMLAAGGKIVIPEPLKSLDPAEWNRLVRQHKVTVWNTVPALMDMYREYMDINNVEAESPLRLILLSGDWIPVELPEQIGKQHPCAQVVSLGGATEASIWSIHYPVQKVDANWPSIPYGVPLANQKIYVLDSEYRQCPIWVPGELYIGGKGLALGYLNNSEETAKRFITNPRTGERIYRTGDMGRFLPDGYIEFLGRNDFQVKINGHRIELEEIERVIDSFPSVARSIVTVYAPAQGGKVLCAYLLCHEDSPIEGNQLQTHLEDRLPPYMVPKHYICLNELPLTANGKVDRNALPAPVAKDVGSNPRQPADTTEKMLTKLWKEILQVRDVGLDDNFFAIGGDSLTATRLVMRINQAMGVELSLPKLFDAPTIMQLAQRIQDEKNLAMDLFSSTDLLDDAALPDGFLVTGEYIHKTRPQRIFFTGATGYLGAYLLDELLRNTNAEIYCLVRANDEKQAMQRILGGLSKYRLQCEGTDRIRAVVGDLSKPAFGLPRAVYLQLASTVDAVYHNGAMVHFLYPYSVMKATNVEGTKEVVRFAAKNKIKHVHHISTISVFSEHGMPGKRIVKESDDIQKSGVLDTGYSQSKWVAEQIVWNARDAGLPVSVYRVGQVIGDTRNGVSNMDDFIFRTMKGVLQSGSYPPNSGELAAIAVDDVAKAIVALSLTKGCAGQAYHLINPTPIKLNALIEWAQKRGHSLQEVQWGEWLQRLRALGSESELFPLLPMFPEAIEEDDGEIEFSQEATLADLAAVNVSIHSISDDLLSKYYRYFLETGYLPNPSLV